MLTPFDDNYFMRQAFLEAKKAFETDEIPVGAVVVANQQVIARAHNLTEQLTDVTAHAEMQAITAAASQLGGKYLKGCTLYVTLEPCVMCAGALAWAQIDRIVYAAKDESRGALRISPTLFHAKTVVEQGTMADECATLLLEFFQKKRTS
ncbi:MAG TPA: nucleoside deaminase [Crocinitomicaceae bacterium]|nr:nucleoside deaminase [Crocinitomicaceae bacterium]